MDRHGEGTAEVHPERRALPRDLPLAQPSEALHLLWHTLDSVRERCMLTSSAKLTLSSPQTIGTGNP